VENPAFRQTKGAPFFLYFPLTGPHTPIAPAAEFRGKSQAGAYGDFVHQIDHLVGQVVAALERNGLAEDTLVIFTSDNGSPCRDGTNMSGAVRSVLRYGHNPSRPWRGIKADVWDGGHRVPFIARWPRRIAAGRTSDETLCHTDLMATVATLLGATLPDDAGEDSYNILPALLGAKLDAPIREATVHHSIGALFAIRQGRWKLIAGLGSGGWTQPRGGKPKPGGPQGQLYDMAADPQEKHNLWLERPDVVTKLTALLHKYKKEGRSAPRR
jgi:arylsulfatase A-like enzyme